MSERPPDPLRPGRIPDTREKGGRNVSVLLVVVLLAVAIAVVIWAIVR